MCKLKDLITDKLYPVEIIERLSDNITSVELVERLWDIIEANVDVFIEDFTVDGEIFE